jgi:hypothetical protein
MTRVVTFEQLSAAVERRFSSEGFWFFFNGMHVSPMTAEMAAADALVAEDDHLSYFRQPGHCSSPGCDNQTDGRALWCRTCASDRQKASKRRCAANRRV